MGTCNEEGCNSIGPSFGMKDEKERYCSKHKLPTMVNIKHNKCSFENCDIISPSFGIKDSKEKYCSKHKTNEMINITHKICENIDCNKRPIFGLINGKVQFCNLHKTQDMIDLNNKKCQVIDCKKQANFNIKGKKAHFCNEHKRNDMINVRDKKCKYLDCLSIPLFGNTNGVYEFCKKHKTDSMINLRSKKCEYKDCAILSSVFDIEGGKGRFCVTHKTDKMIDVKSKRCTYEKCLSRANFNIKGESASYCSIHKKDNMIDVNHILCDNCVSIASYGKPGTKPSNCLKHREKGMIRRSNGKCLVCKIPALYGKNFMPIHCEIHKKDDEQNLIEMPCISCNLIMILDKNNKCEYCNPEIFNTARLAKQNALMNYLDNRKLHGKSTDIIINNGECGKERPDRIYELKDKIIILECDENQHKDRQCSCEQIRMVNIGQSYGGTPVYFIRWNPDDYLPENDKKEPEIITKRYKLLGDLLDSIIKEKTILPIALVSSLYMYYDGWSSLAEEEWKIITPLSM